ncbi:MAG TPA: hypothetical protein VJT71_08845, partial [Pyrinomonadaceae bacterium]|nr:hypothetical protein [Pyrinomonadaceae bacterium]
SWSALVFLSCFGVIAFSRAATFDIVLTMALTGALSSFFVWYLRTSFANSGTGKHQHLLLGFYFFLGLSLLAKGLVGSFLAVAVVGGFFIVRRELPPRVLLKSLLWGIPGTLAVAAVWYGPMTYRHGWLFIDQFFVQHHFARFLTNKFHHPQPFYFYIPIFGLLVLPWTVFLGAGLASLRLSSLREDSALGRMRIFAILLIVLIVGLFSMSVSKLPAYVLPAVPAAALLVADRITAYRAKQSGKVTVRVSGILFLIAAVAANWVLWRATEVPRSSVIAGTAACAVSGLFALIFPRKTTAACLLFAGASAVVAIAAILGSGGLAARDSVRDLIRLASNRGYGSAAVVGLHTVERTAEFYSADRLLYGEDGEPVKFESAADVAAAARNSGGQILCFVPVEHASQLTNYPKVQTETIANNGSVSLLLVRVR